MTAYYAKLPANPAEFGMPEIIGEGHDFSQAVANLRDKYNDWAKGKEFPTCRLRDTLFIMDWFASEGIVVWCGGITDH